MGNLLYIVAAILVITWSVAFLGYNNGGFFHFLLGAGIALFVLRVIQGNKVH